MLETNEIKRMLDDCKMFREMLQYKRLEETRRIGSNLAEKSFCDFKIFSGLSENSKLKEEIGRASCRERVCLYV